MIFANTIVVTSVTTTTSIALSCIIITKGTAIVIKIAATATSLINKAIIGLSCFKTVIIDQNYFAAINANSVIKFNHLESPSLYSIMKIIEKFKHRLLYFYQG
jgi:uncharacterized linocin/CFP29 family protein